MAASHIACCCMAVLPLLAVTREALPGTATTLRCATITSSPGLIHKDSGVAAAIGVVWFRIMSQKATRHILFGLSSFFIHIAHHTKKASHITHRTRARKIQHHSSSLTLLATLRPAVGTAALYATLRPTLRLAVSFPVAGPTLTP